MFVRSLRCTVCFSDTECKYSVFDPGTMISLLWLWPRGGWLPSVWTHPSSSPAFPSTTAHLYSVSSLLLCGGCICSLLSTVLLKSAWQQYSSPRHGLMLFCSELNMVTNLPFKHFQCTVIPLIAFVWQPTSFPLLIISEASSPQRFAVVHLICF